ncbi:nucleoside deaminase [Thermodesulfobacteriota bacterium]
MEEGHIKWMRIIVEGAKAAAAEGEAPVAAIVVQDDQVLGLGRDTTISQKCGFAHADLNALMDARISLDRHPEGVTIYSTLEPCAMCLGAITFAGINKLVYGADDPDGGAVKLFQNHPSYKEWMPEVIEGVLKDECEDLKKLKTFKAKGSSI